MKTKFPNPLALLLQIAEHGIDDVQARAPSN